MSVIVVADDDTDIRDLVVYRLQRDGHEVHAFADGTSALAHLSDEPADLAILDVMMPGLSGFDVARAMRQNPALSGTKIILLTARTQEADVEQGYAAGADDYVAKPFSPRELATRVTTMLRQP